MLELGVDRAAGNRDSGAYLAVLTCRDFSLRIFERGSAFKKTIIFYDTINEYRIS